LQHAGLRNAGQGLRPLFVIQNPFVEVAFDAGQGLVDVVQGSTRQAGDAIPHRN